MTAKAPTDWNATSVRTWLERRVVAARSDQVAAQRSGRSAEDDCDKATAEEMVCTLLLGGPSVDDRQAFANDLRVLLDRGEYVWRGVYDDTRFDRHVRTYVRKLVRMTKTNEGFDRTARFQ